MLAHRRAANPVRRPAPVRAQLAGVRLGPLALGARAAGSGQGAGRARRGRGGQRTGEQTLHGVKDELMHGARIAEADFGFLRMHIDVDRRRVDLQEQAVGRVAAAVQLVLVGLAQRVAEQLVAHEAAVDVAVLGVAARARVGRQRAVAGDAQRSGGRRVARDSARKSSPRIAPTRRGASHRFFRCRLTRPLCERVKATSGCASAMRLTASAQCANSVAFGLEELSPRRRVVVEVAHFDDRAGEQRGRLGAAPVRR
jgi:hypothetical protein